MEIEILKIVYDYSINRRIIDENFIRQLFKIVVDSHNLDKYVNDVRIQNGHDSKIVEFKKDDGVLVGAYYNPLSKDIVFYPDLLNIFLLHDLNYKNNGFNDIEMHFYKNCFFTQIILHELEHVNQFKKVSLDSDDIENLILKESYSEIQKITFLINCGYPFDLAYQLASVNMTKLEKKQKCNELLPEERLAQYYSYDEIISVLKYIKDYVPKVLKFFQCRQLEYTMNDYDINGNEIISPLLSYYKILDDCSNIHKFDWYDIEYSKCLSNAKRDYSLFDRIKYGLPIDNNEYESINNSIKVMKL